MFIVHFNVVYYTETMLSAHFPGCVVFASRDLSLVQYMHS